MDVLLLVGRILYSLIFILSGFNHFAQLGNMSGYAQSKGVPGPKFWVVVTGLMTLVGGLSVLLGYQIQIGAILLFIFLILADFTMHRFWGVADKQAAAGEMAHFMKNLALAGAALILYAAGAGAYAIG